MPSALHPQAKFDPIPPDLDLYGLVDRSSNFEWVLRISTHQIRNLGPEEFEKLVILHVINGGKPLVIEGWKDVLPDWLFSAEWLEKTYDKKQENVRDISARNDIPMTTGHYLRSMKQLTNQWSPTNYRDERRQRLYLKDIDCPPEWHDHLRKVIPPSLFYMNENVTDRGESDKRADDIFSGANETTAAPAGDLMSSLPEEMRAQNLMCYIGHEGTFTPAHREMCASLGQNIMVEASGGENGEKPGSSIWFMTETKDREVVREYFLSMLGHDVEIEKHFAQINAWKKATFPVYIVDQRPGDFILIPPLAPHQVWNRGTRTMKVAWNRTTAETLDLAIREALPKARLVCRDEQYKNKAIIYYTLKKYYQALQETEEKNDMGLVGFDSFGEELFRSSPRFKQLARDFKALFGLFSDILTDEMFATKEKNIEYVEFDSCVTCSYCRSNIFNRFLTCKNCVRTLVGGDEDAYDICMECYAMGRSCMCQSHLTWCEQFPWTELVDNYERWRGMVIKNDGFVDLEFSPQVFEVARTRRGKKSTAQICQEALHRRPFKDLNKVEVEEKALSESEPEVDDEGRPVKKKKKRKAKKGDLRRCHVCCHKDYTYRVQECTNPHCREAYCYGVLYRAFDMMPQAVLENEDWLCPKCLKICNCGACRRAEIGNPYMPKNTLLGHDTKAVADDRSVELLVDFRVHNLNWLKAMGEESRNSNSKRMNQLRQQADTAKASDETGPAAEEAIANATNGTLPPEGFVGNGFDAENGNNMFEDAMHNGHFPEDAQAEQIHDHTELDNTEFSGALDPALDASTFVDEATYPDTLLGAQRMLGMGYYDQDTGPDQILFDPFQMPTADAMVFDEEAEVVKKTLRAQKRKAKQENEDDPDFYQPKTYHKKKKVQESADLSTLDPALFGTGGATEVSINADVTMTGTEDAAGPEPAADQQQQQQQHERDGEGGGAQVEPTSPQQPVVEEIHVPALRHAKPRVSYAEVEEPLVDDPDDIVPVRHMGPRKPRQPKPKLVDLPIAIDITDDAAAGVPQTGEAAEGAVATPSQPPRKRGRPPRSSFTPISASALAEKTAELPESEPSSLRRDGRANRRSTLGAMEVSYREIPSDEDEGAPVRDRSSNDGNYGGTKPPEIGPDGNPVPRRRGRPRKNPLPVPDNDDKEADADEGVKRLSMAERLGAKGKPFRIASRGSLKTRGRPPKKRPAEPRTSIDGDEDVSGMAEDTDKDDTQQINEDEEEAAADETVAKSLKASPKKKGTEAGSEAAAGEEEELRVVSPSPVPEGSDMAVDSSSSPPPPPPPKPKAKRGKPTVVRLGSHSGSEYASAQNEHDDDDDDDEHGSAPDIASGTDSSDGDIPASIPRGHAIRSRGRGRGRGRPRGRGAGPDRRSFSSMAASSPVSEVSEPRGKPIARARGIARAGRPRGRGRGRPRGRPRGS